MALIETGQERGMKVKVSVLFMALFFLLVAFQSPFAMAESRDPAVTPPPGSTERKLIVDALREELQKYHGTDMVFLIKYLKTQGGWAWIETLPRSPDGKNQYEDVSALLRKSGTEWKVAEIACSEIDNEECLDSPNYFQLLRKRFPGIPVTILPER